MRIVVNWSLCDGNGNCAKEAPELFAIDENDTMRLLRETFGEEHRAGAEAAVRACPKNALTLLAQEKPDGTGPGASTKGEDNE